MHVNTIKYGTTNNLYSLNRESSLSPEGSCRECLNRMVIMPDSPFKIFWNIVTIILLIYTAIFVPYNVAFNEANKTPLG